MKYYLERLEKEIIESAAGVIGSAPGELSVEEANPKFGADLAIPCFALSKQLGRAPQEIATDISSKLSHEAIEKAEATGGYVNIWLNPKELARQIANDVKTAGEYGATDEGRGQTAVVDYIGLNLSKPFSVGHLRPSVQGAALINLYRALGYEVIGDSHLGDWGTPFGMWVVAYEKWGSEEALEKDGAYELGRLYAKFRKESDKNPALIDEAKTWLKKLEAGDKQALEYKNRFSKISLDHMNKILERLKIKADENLSESFYITEAKKLVDELVESGVALRQEDGSVIVRLDEHGIETPILLQKSDGSLLYATTDIQTIKHRIETWNPKKIIYSVGAEQKFHFQQVFALARKLGYSVELIHAWFGTIDELDEKGQRRKMSSRKSSALLENLLDKAFETAKSKINTDGISDDDIEKVAIGAVKFTDFMQARRTNILFNWERMFNLQGFSGPYVQYAAVRIGSILRKLDVQETDWQTDYDYDWQTEAGLLKILAKYPGIIKESAREYEPHKVAQYAYDLAREFNKYYETVSISNSSGESRRARIGLLRFIRHNFEHALGLLGIEVPTKM